MKKSDNIFENPFAGRFAFNLDYQTKFSISLANNDLLNYAEKKKKKKSFFADTSQARYS